MQLTGDHSTPITCTYWNELMSSFSDPPLCEGADQTTPSSLSNAESLEV